MKRLYLDNCATTPLAPEVCESMADHLRGCYGNPSSIHHEGRLAARVLADCRKNLAESLGAKPAEIIFTGSGTESNNLAIGGVVGRAIRSYGRAKVVTSTVEHASVRTRIAWEKRLHGDSLTVVEVPVDHEGMLNLDTLDVALGDDVTLVALLAANNETGTLLDLDALKMRKLRHPNVVWLLDIVQMYTKVPLDVRLWPFDMLSFCAHKIHGPKGIGALFVRGGIELDPMVVGGAQEKYRRAGTENLAGIVGFSKAVDLALPPEDCAQHMRSLEQVFLETLRSDNVEFNVNGPAEPGARRLPGFLNLSFPGVASREDLQIALDLEGVQLSSTSACHSGVSEPSHVLAAMGIDGERLTGAIRLLFNRYHTTDDARTAAKKIAMVTRRIQLAGAQA